MIQPGDNPPTLALIVSKQSAKKIRNQLEQQGLFDSSHKLMPLDGDSVAVPVKQDFPSVCILKQQWQDYAQKTLCLPLSKKSQATLNTPWAKLSSELYILMQQQNIEFHSAKDLATQIPRKWERHEDLIIIPESAFVSEECKKIANLWEVVAKCLSCQRLARHSRVANDGVRSSQVTMLLGNDGRVTHTDSGIRYSYDVTKCMFSAGNISEKLRVASWDCTNQTVVDLYAGIGYFTLPYLVHAGAAHVHACEWNPHALLALRGNLQDNGVQDRCTVHPGDCRQLQLAPVADHVNLGLIPSSEEGWPTAVRVLNRSGGFLHIHANVEDDYYANKSDLHPGTESSVVEEADCLVKSNSTMHQACKLWAASTEIKILDLLHKIKDQKRWSVRQIHLEIVKSYAPHIVHVVLDLECRPIDSS